MQNNYHTVVDVVIASRKSVRGFTEQSVDPQLIKHILTVASRSPSGTNIQPWKVHVLTGNFLVEFGQGAMETYANPELMAKQPKKPFDYYPTEWFSPYIERRRKVGYDLYAVLGIEKKDKDAMQTQHTKNYNFFGAPVGLIFTMNPKLSIGSLLDFGMFIQSIMISAQSHGLATCPQAAWILIQGYIREKLNLNDDLVICGMAMGYENQQELANKLTTEREIVDNFAQFY
jgi:nitroreductase